MPTIADVAKLANVSKATVSRVLNSLPVSEQTYQRVISAIKSLNYRPNAQARSLTLRRTNLIGVVGPFMGGLFYGELLTGIISVMSGTDNFVTVYGTENTANEENVIHRLLSEQRVDGLIVMTPRVVKHDIFKSFKNFPIVVVDGALDYVPSVVSDNCEGAKTATEHLIRLGHQRIAIITGPPGSRESAERCSGFKSALAENDLKVPEAYIRAGNYDIASGRCAMEELLEQIPRPTAVLAANDLMAIGGIELLKEKGLSIPGDMAVVGFDDTILAPRVTPALTTVRQPIFEMGRVAARRLLDSISKVETYATRTILRCELVVRASCGGQPTAVDEDISSVSV